MSPLGGGGQHRPITTATALHFTNLQQQKVCGTIAASIKKKFLSEEKTKHKESLVDCCAHAETTNWGGIVNENE